MADRKISQTHMMRIITRAIFVLCLLQAVINLCVAEDGETVIEALLEFSKAIDKDKSVLSNWTKDTDPCEWSGIKCKDKSHVSRIALEGFHLNGTLNSSALCQAKTLRVLSLMNNNIEGPLSSDISDCLGIQRIYLSNNKLSGPIPIELTGLKRLQLLYVANNNLSGQLPPFNSAIDLDISGNPELCGGVGMQKYSDEATPPRQKGDHSLIFTSVCGRTCYVLVI